MATFKSMNGYHEITDEVAAIPDELGVESVGDRAAPGMICPRRGETAMVVARCRGDSGAPPRRGRRIAAHCGPATPSRHAP